MSDDHKNRGRYMDTDGMKELRAAVVMQACHDYARHKKRKDTAKASAVKRWFHSEDFRLYSSLNPDDILAAMDKNVKKGRIFNQLYDRDSHKKRAL